MMTARDDIDCAIYQMNALLAYLGRHATEIDDEDHDDLEELRAELETLLQKLRYPILMRAAE